MHKTINEAVTAVLKEHGGSLSVKEIYNTIKEKNYYQFSSKNPEAIVSGVIRKKTAGPQSKGKIEYIKVLPGIYTLISV